LERSVIDRKLLTAAKHLLDLCRERGLQIATAESCTGGLMAAVLTEIAGASDVVERGFVVYSNAAKESMLCVPTSMLKRYGAVSAETAIAMVTGALKNSEADISVSITGIAGPGGGTKQKPVGLVHFAAARRHGKPIARRRLFGKIGRRRIRERSVAEALELLALVAQPTGRARK
jgi:nicotinamide-nucleotide amidase